MRLIQTFWSCRRNILENSYGWLSPQYHLMAWTLSCLRLKEYYEDLHLYTDSPANEVLIQRIGLPYKKVHVVYDHIDERYKNFYALPKILTYSMQEKPFIHVDGDVFLWRRFSQKLEESDLIAQNIEKGTVYYKNMMDRLKSELIYLPICVEEEISKSSISSYNAGVLGGNDLLFLKEFANTAQSLIKKNCVASKANKIPGSFNILFEQILFYTLSIKKNKTVGCVLNEVIEDFGYSKAKFADFSLVPQELNFLHLIGAKKMDYEICALLSRALMQEYPDYFYKILEIFSSSHRFFKTKINRLFKKEPKKYIKSDSLNYLYEYPSFNKTLSILNPKETQNKAITFKQIQAVVKNDNTVKLKEIFEYECRLLKIIKKWENIDLDYLFALQSVPANILEPFIQSKELQEKTYFEKNPYLEVIEGSFTWAVETKQCIDPNLVSKECSDNYGLVHIPQIFFNGYCEIIIDELEYNILTILERPMTFTNILTLLDDCFPTTKDDDFYYAKYQLILLKLKRLFLTNCVILCSKK
jgi:uncharacterized protein DUF6734